MAGVQHASFGRPFTAFGVTLRTGTFEDAVAWILSIPGSDRRERIHFCNVHALVTAQDDPQLMQAFAPPATVLPDGMPLVWLARRSAMKLERVAGPDRMEAILDRGRRQGARHFFYGGAPGVAESLAKATAIRFPGLIVAGIDAPPFREMSPEEDAAVVEAINSVSPDYLWVGLGSPKQERWLVEHRDRLTVPAMLAVGAAFNFHSGAVRRAPRWMRRSGLEWVFRLLQEPRRLWRRYAFTNARFVEMVLSGWINGSMTRSRQ
jgi:N-acetylglucosaminyldiphosphoundecaprenol N-acetyl-beta-D-mannosaminyltransferase